MSNFRYKPVISVNSETNSEEKWLSKLQKELTKSAVEPYRVDNSLFNQINEIMNGSSVKSKYTSVEAAVEDMKERSGLTEYLNKINKHSENKKDNIKVSTAALENVPEVFAKIPHLQETAINYIQSTKGNIPISAILDKLKSIYYMDVSEDIWDDEDLLIYLSKLNLQEKRKHNYYNNYKNMGKNDVNDNDIDPSNTDAFHVLTPTQSF